MIGCLPHNEDTKEYFLSDFYGFDHKLKYNGIIDTHVISCLFSCVSNIHSLNNKEKIMFILFHKSLQSLKNANLSLAHQLQNIAAIMSIMENEKHSSYLFSFIKQTYGFVNQENVHVLLFNYLCKMLNINSRYFFTSPPLDADPKEKFKYYLCNTVAAVGIFFLTLKVMDYHSPELLKNENIYMLLVSMIERLVKMSLENGDNISNLFTIFKPENQENNFSLDSSIENSLQEDSEMVSEDVEPEDSAMFSGEDNSERDNLERSNTDLSFEDDENVELDPRDQKIIHVIDPQWQNIEYDSEDSDLEEETQNVANSHPSDHEEQSDSNNVHEEPNEIQGNDAYDNGKTFAFEPYDFTYIMENYPFFNIRRNFVKTDGFQTAFKLVEEYYRPMLEQILGHSIDSFLPLLEGNNLIHFIKLLKKPTV